MDPARNLLHSLQTHAQAKACLVECFKRIQANRATKGRLIADVCDELAHQILDVMQNKKYKLITPAQATTLKPLLVEKAKKRETDSIKFSRLEHLLKKVEAGAMLDPTDKKDKHNLITDANTYLQQALPDLLNSRDLTNLETEMSHTEIGNFDPFLKCNQFVLNPTDVFQKNVQYLVSNLAQIQEFLARHAGKPEAENFFANFGRFLTAFAPCYNALWTLQDTLNAKQKQKTTGMNLLTVDVCNAFLTAGKETPIAALPVATSPIAIPAFSKAAAVAPKAANAHPLSILSKAQNHPKLADFFAAIKTTRTQFQKSYDAFGRTMGYDENTKKYVSFSPKTYPNDVKDREALLNKVLKQQSEDLVDSILDQMDKKGMITVAEGRELRPELLKRAGDFDNANKIESDRFSKTLDDLEKKQIQADAELVKLATLEGKLASTVKEAQTYLDLALVELKTTFTKTLTSQINKQLWTNLQPLFNPNLAGQPIQLNPCIEAISHLVGNQLILEASVLEPERRVVGYWNDKGELRNFYANLGKFLQNLGPYYNAIVTDLNEIRKLEGVKAVGLAQLFPSDVCYMFFKFGDANSLSATIPLAPTNPPTIPTFTPFAPKLPPKNPPNPPAPPTGKNPVPPPAPTDKTSPPTAPAKPASKKPESKPKAKENGFVTVILWPFRMIGSIFSAIWNAFFGTKKS